VHGSQRHPCTARNITRARIATSLGGGTVTVTLHSFAIATYFTAAR